MTQAEDPRDTDGMRIRREVLGDDHVDRAVAATTPFTAPFQEFITRTAWGDIWARAGLDRRTRSAITLAILTALRAEGEIPLHVRAAIRNGLTPDEIGGDPAAHRAVCRRAGRQRRIRRRPAHAGGRSDAPV